MKVFVLPFNRMRAFTDECRRMGEAWPIDRRWIWGSVERSEKAGHDGSDEDSGLSADLENRTFHPHVHDVANVVHITMVIVVIVIVFEAVFVIPHPCTELFDGVILASPFAGALPDPATVLKFALDFTCFALLVEIFTRYFIMTICQSNAGKNGNRCKGFHLLVSS